MDRSISAKHVITQNATLVAAVAIIIAAGIAFDNFFTVVNLSNIFRQASMIGIMAIGSSFVILTGGMISRRVRCLGSLPLCAVL